MLTGTRQSLPRVFCSRLLRNNVPAIHQDPSSKMAGLGTHLMPLPYAHTSTHMHTRICFSFFETCSHSVA